MVNVCLSALQVPCCCIDKNFLVGSIEGPSPSCPPQNLSAQNLEHSNWYLCARLSSPRTSHLPEHSPCLPLVLVTKGLRAVECDVGLEQHRHVGDVQPLWFQQLQGGHPPRTCPTAPKNTVWEWQYENSSADERPAVSDHVMKGAGLYHQENKMQCPCNRSDQQIRGLYRGLHRISGTVDCC